MGQVELSLDYTHEHTVYEANYSKDSAQIMRVISLSRLHLPMLVIIVLFSSGIHVRLLYIFSELTHAVITL